MATQEIRKALDNIKGWGDLDKEIAMNTISVGQSEKTFRQLFTDNNVDKTKALFTALHTHATKGDLHIKRDWIEQKLRQISSDISIPKGYAMRKDNKGNYTHEEEDRQRNMPLYAGVGQLRGSIRQVFPDMTATTNADKDYIRIALQTKDE